jgi:hypothetical protein
MALKGINTPSLYIDRKQHRTKTESQKHKINYSIIIIYYSFSSWTIQQYLDLKEGKEQKKPAWNGIKKEAAYYSTNNTKVLPSKDNWIHDDLNATYLW